MLGRVDNYFTREDCPRLRVRNACSLQVIDLLAGEQATAGAAGRAPEARVHMRGTPGLALEHTAVRIDSLADADTATAYARTRSVNWGSCDKRPGLMTALPNRGHAFVRLLVHNRQEGWMGLLHIVDLIGAQPACTAPVQFVVLDPVCCWAYSAFSVQHCAGAVRCFGSRVLLGVLCLLRATLRRCSLLFWIPCVAGRILPSPCNTAPVQFVVLDHVCCWAYSAFSVQHCAGAVVIWTAGCWCSMNLGCALQSYPAAQSPAADESGCRAAGGRSPGGPLYPRRCTELMLCAPRFRMVGQDTG